MIGLSLPKLEQVSRGSSIIATSATPNENKVKVEERDARTNGCDKNYRPDSMSGYNNRKRLDLL